MEEFNRDLPMEIDPQGQFTKKVDFHENPQKIKIVDFYPHTNQWGKKEYRLVAMDKDKNDIILTLSGKGKNQLINLLGNVVSRDMIDKTITVEAAYIGKTTVTDNTTGNPKEVDSYEWIFS